MSLFDALLLDSYRMTLWIASRTDGVGGSGTQSDPFDGSTQSKFDAVMNALPLQVLSITAIGTTATVTALSHPYANGSLVLIDGATGAAATHYNGPFTISGVTANTFQYTTAGGAPSGSATGTLTCRASSVARPNLDPMRKLLPNFFKYRLTSRGGGYV